MDIRPFVQKQVKHLYWHDDVNCAAADLLTLSKQFNVKLSDQVIDSALGMHGAGKYGAQCGLVDLLSWR